MTPPSGPPTRINAGPWRWALVDADLTTTQHHVALALGVYMDKDGGNARPSLRTLERACRRHRDTIARVLDELVIARWLARQTVAPRTPAVYSATCPAVHSTLDTCPSCKGQPPKATVQCAGCRCPVCKVPLSSAQGSNQQSTSFDQQKTGAHQRAAPAGRGEPARFSSDWEGQESGPYR